VGVRTEALRCAVIAAAVAIPLALLGPPPGDLPAHLYRTELVRDGVLLWDTYWYAGHYPLLSYSLLYYFPAALIGNEPLAVAAVIVSAALFASLVERGWGPDTRWASRAFAVAACGPLFTGTYPYAVGVAAALGALKALQCGRTGLAIVFVGLAMGFSPLAFLFLSLVLAAVFLARLRIDRRTLVVGAALLAFAGLQATAVEVFPHGAEYPFFRPAELAALLALAAACAALVLRARRGRILALVFGLWLVAALVAFLVASPIGENITRLRGIAVPLALLAAGLAGYRPRWLAVFAVCGALVYTLVPYVAVIPYKGDARPAEREFWEPALAFLEERSGENFRVEVVPTGDHWEAYWLPRAGFPLARGWYRQIDIAENPLFYEEPLSPGEYRAWLERLGVRYVLLPDTQLGRAGEAREAELLRSGAAGLEPVSESGSGTIYAVPDPEPILAGPGRPRLSSFGHDRIEGTVTAPGLYRLAVRFTPTWRVEEGVLCVEEASDGMTRLVVERPGPFVLGVGLRGSRGCPTARR
jgi:hypothetical protein